MNLQMPSEFALQGNQLYNIRKRQRHSGRTYDAWEIWLSGRYIRDLTELEIGLIIAGFNEGRRQRGD